MENSAKRVNLTLKVLPSVKSTVERIAQENGGTPSRISEILLQRGIKEYDRAGSIVALIKSEAPVQESRISRETREILFTALRAILEQAPSTVIEATRRLTDTAGKYGGEREAERQRPHNEKRSR